MLHRETNPYFIQGSLTHNGLQQPPPATAVAGASHVLPLHDQGSVHGQLQQDEGPKLIPPNRDNRHPQFILPQQGEGSHSQHAPKHHDQQPENQSHDPQHTSPQNGQDQQHPPPHIPFPYPPHDLHSFQVPLQQGKKTPKPKKGQHSKSKQTPLRPEPDRHSQLPHIYVPHDIRHQEPSDTRHQEPRRSQSQRHQQPHGLRVPHPRKTKPVTWFVAVFCALFWLIIFLGGMIVLIVYLLYRPHSPKFEVSNVALNAAYLDMGNLLNADVRVLANFTNINKKVKVDFTDMVMNLHYGRTLIATQYIKPFSETKQEHVLLDIHLVSSQVQLPLQDSQRLARQIENNRVALQVKGLFHTRYNLGSLLKYTYLLYSDCKVVITGPPNGVLVAKNCRTKR